MAQRGRPLTRLFSCLLLALAWTGAPAEQPRGLPFIRTYPLDEIGKVPRGLRLGTDAYGRVAVMYDGVYSVLNDTTWVDRVHLDSSSRVRMTTVRVANGQYYYGGRGSWGVVELTSEGRFRPSPLVPANAPDWTAVTPFNRVLTADAGIYFYELNGVVFWDFKRRENAFFPMPRVSTAFLAGDRLLVSCEDGSLHAIDPALHTSRPLDVPGLTGRVVLQAEPLDTSRTLLLLPEGQLAVFDGNSVTPWSPQRTYALAGRVTAMVQLVGGGVALALEGDGLYLFDRDGGLLWALQLPEFQRVSTMISGERGVVWALGQNGVHRVYYDSPLTSFGQELGVTALWPKVARWRDAHVICSGRVLHQMEAGRPGYPSSFRPVLPPGAPDANHMATNGVHLLTADSGRVYSVQQDGSYQPLIRIENTAGMEFLGPDICVVLGSREIAALRQVNGVWSECAPRIAGVGDSPINVQKTEALWVERGGDQVARITLEQGKLQMEHVSLPWQGAQWTNVGRIGGTIILSGNPGQRCYLDAVTGAPVERPRLDQLLGRSPFWILRVTEDDAGILWATHAQGVVKMTPKGDDYAVDAATYELRNDSYPRVTVFPGNDTWILAGRSVYHVERRIDVPPPPQRANLVSVFADQQQHEFLQDQGIQNVPRRFSFDDNSLSFRFFSGTYAWRSPPRYEYRLVDSDPWTSVDPSLVLAFPKLRDGRYELQVRAAEPREAEVEPFTFSFAIEPPWYRTSTSYAAAAVLALLAFLGATRWVAVRSSRRTAILEKLVQERTRELEHTMEQLGEETRNAATLAERSRLAGEIHDSLQQGLSGAILHLDTTMTHPSLKPEVHAQLHVVRNMLSYSREEVQQAVWNLESPLLQDSTLAAALQKLVTYINPGQATIDVTVPESGATLETAIQHNLLRIAQEAMTNAVKHSGASRIHVALQTLPDTVELSVTDNGRGFDPNLGKTDKHFGLRGMQSRAKLIRATLAILSSPGSGTTVSVRLSGVGT